ncbi:unnamed protein product [Caenorhabditis sp. 36 PRJEB53466]|nr:unnamed protein product [Caenorhabditis sp. 36 PRJEB53466]
MSPLLLLLLLLIHFTSSAIIPIPLPSPPNPIPEPPTVSLTALTAEKQTPTTLKVTSAADHLPRNETKLSRNRVRLHSHNSKSSKTREVEILDAKCNDESLQEIMQDAMTPSLSTSKMVISERATRDFGTPFDVICARGHFSYYVEASTYCEVTQNDVTCFAYRSSANIEADSGRNRLRRELSKRRRRRPN